MTMNSKFNGVCKKCNISFPAGTKIEWSKATGATHTVCPASRPVFVAQPVVADGAPIARFIQAAKDRGLKFPKARFMAVGREMVLSLAGNTSKYPGSVQVKVGGEWVGRIEPTGKVAGPLSNRKDVLDTLASIAVDPAAAAKAYGALTCSCSFCGKGLTDEGSVEVGYGPVCAAHWGLPHTPKGTPVVLQASFKQVAMATPAVSQMMDF